MLFPQSHVFFGVVLFLFSQIVSGCLAKYTVLLATGRMQILVFFSLFLFFFFVLI